MNAIVSLNHFCDLHGPSVIFCTQAFHARKEEESDDESESDEEIESMEDGDGGDSTVSYNPSTASKASRASRLRGYYNEARRREYSPTASEAGGVSQYVTEKFKSSATVCNACSSVGPFYKPQSTTRLHDEEASDEPKAAESEKDKEDDVDGYVSSDHKLKVSYVSTHYPDNAKLYSVLRQACVRSLSCEVTPGREGPVMFGDHRNGYCVSYTFHLADTQARGHQRFWSIVFLMTDKTYLANSWPFLCNNMAFVVTKLQAMAKAIYDKEKKKQSGPQLGSNRVGLLGDRFMRMRTTHSFRGLAQLLEQPHIWREIHLAFCWILSGCSIRLVEKQLEGEAMLATPSNAAYLYKEEKEEQREDEEGVLSPMKMPLDVTFSNVSLFSIENSAANVSTVSSVKSNGSQSGGHNSLIGLRMLLGAQLFGQLVYGVVAGNQIVVRGPESVTSAMVKVVSVLLPARHISSVAVYDDQYRPIWECPVLGLEPSCEIPSDVDRKTMLLIDIAEKPQASQRSVFSDSGCSSNDVRSGCAEGGITPGSGSSNRYYGVTLSTDLRRFPTNTWLASRICEIFDAAAKSCNPTETNLSEERVILAQITALKEEWMTMVKAFFTWSRSVTERKSRLNIKQFLVIFQLQDTDVPILQFWTSGIARSARLRLMKGD
eukprot:Clim_evm24s141 gene=Clim_evmTU24s141